ncbi:MAG: hypothetical protein KF723_21990 [Rhizobiaceae bacterium]|nr:hypothetical protein [Rhizobiaceae bacterium]
MSAINRKGVILNHEGQILQLAGSAGPDTASDYARCVVDGAMNAIIRMEGAEKASAFAFGVADRVAGGLREPTAIFPVASAPSLSTPADDVTERALDALEAVLSETPASPPAAMPGIPPWVYGCAVIVAMCIGFMAGQGWPR